MARLIPCPTCKHHVLVNEQACPHCGAALRSAINPTVPAVLLGLAMTGCLLNAEPAYGVPESTSDTGSETATGTDTSDTTNDTSTTAGEAEYGVPDTGIDTGTDSTDSTGTDTGTDTSTSTDTTGEPLYGLGENI